MNERQKFFNTLRQDKPFSAKAMISAVQGGLGTYNIAQFLGQLIGWYWYRILGYAGVLGFGIWLDAKYQVNSARWPYLFILLLAAMRTWQWINEDKVNFKSNRLPQGMISFEIAGFKPSAIRGILSAATAPQKKAAALRVQKNYVLILTYAALFIYILLWIAAIGLEAQIENAAQFERILRGLCWTIIGAAILNALENQLLLWMLTHKEPIQKRGWPRLAASMAVLKLWVLFTALAMIQLTAITGFLKILAGHPEVLWMNLIGAGVIGLLTLSVLFIPPLKRMRIVLFEHLLVLLALAVTLGFITLG